MHMVDIPYSTQRRIDTKLATGGVFCSHASTHDFQFPSLSNFVFNSLYKLFCVLYMVYLWNVVNKIVLHLLASSFSTSNIQAVIDDQV
jgi:hypothetical protein